jgi:hypothetical protein
VLKVR